MRFIQRYLKPTDVVFTTWREDGHCDHEAVGRASAAAAQAVGATLYELPVVDLALGDPEDRLVPWHRARKIPLTCRKPWPVSATLSMPSPAS